MNKFKWMIALAVVFFVCAQSTTADFMSEEDKTINVAESLMKSTVTVNVVGGQASGFFITADEIITNAHVVQSATTVFITKESGKMCVTDVLKTDTEHDLALLKSYCDGAPLKITDLVKVGQTALVMGDPLDRRFFLTKGIVSSLSVKGLVLTDAFVDFGNSGSPLVNLNGEVIGVVMGKFKQTNIGAAVNAEELKRFLKGG